MFDIDRWQEIWITITRNKSRSVMTGFGVFWGILMLVLMLGAGTGLKNLVMGTIEGFATNSVFFYSDRTSEPYKGFAKGRYWQMRNRDIDVIKQQVTGVKYISPVLWQQIGENNVVYGLKTGTYMVRGVMDDFFKIETQHVLEGRLLNSVDIAERRKVCVIGSEVRKVLFEPDKSPIGEYIRTNGIYYQVVGVIEPIPDVHIGGRTEESVNVPFTTLQQTGNFGDKFYFLCVTAADGIPCERVTDEIVTILKTQNQIAPTDNQAVGSFAIAAQFEKIQMLFLGINILIWIVSLGTLLAGVVGISNIMMVTVKERTREIGIRRAIGAKPSSIVSQIMTESLVLTIIAGCGGLCLGVFILAAIDSVVTSSGAPDAIHPEISFGAAVVALVVLLLSGLVAGLIPVWRAMQIKAIDAIRDE